MNIQSTPDLPYSSAIVDNVADRQMFYMDKNFVLSTDYYDIYKYIV